MKVLTAKQEARLEKKKKKVAALVEIVRLNDRDRKLRLHSSGSSASEFEESAPKRVNNIDSDLKFDVTEEPTAKKTKKNPSADCSNNSKPPPPPTNGSNNISNVLAGGFSESSDLQPIDGNSTMGTFSLTGDQYAHIKREINKRKRAIRSCSKLRLKYAGDQASLATEDCNRTPIFLTDIQHLLMFALIGNSSPCYPSRWCHIEKGSKLSHTVVAVIEGLSLFHFLSHESLFVESNKIFEHKLEMIMPLPTEGIVLEELAAVPLTNSQKEDLILKYGSLEVAIELNKDPTLLVKTMFPVSGLKEEEVQNYKEIEKIDKFPRTKLLLSALQMVDEGYPVPLRGELALRYLDYVLTKDKYYNVTPDSPMFGLDCEMCTTAGGSNELTRISIVDENLMPIYESLVRPSNKIVDYLTPYSGITPEMMLNATKTLSEVQADIRALLPADAILVGQSLNSDLHALKMMHPYVIDTSVIFNVTGDRKRKVKLQILMKKFLGEVIQDGNEGHCPVEDSQAAMKLAKLKLSQAVEFGDVILKGRMDANNLIECTAEIRNNLLGHASQTEKRTAIITSNDFDGDLDKIFNNKIQTISSETSDNINLENYIHWYKTESNKGLIRKTRQIVQDYALTISNLKITSQKLELSQINKTISNVDKCINKLWNCVAHNGLFIVLLGGAPGTTSGVAMVKIKKNLSDGGISDASAMM